MTRKVFFAFRKLNRIYFYQQMTDPSEVKNVFRFVERNKLPVFDAAIQIFYFQHF